MAVAMKRNFIDVRVDAGFETQLQLAQAAKVAESTVWLAENGRVISRKSARKIVNAFKNKGIDIEVTDVEWNVR